MLFLHSLIARAVARVQAETFCVLHGEWEFVAGERTIVARTGEIVHIPRGAFHSFLNSGPWTGN